jgi:hypothetical protein
VKAGANPMPTPNSVAVESTRSDDQLTHIERINRNTVNPAHVPGLDYVPPAGKGRYRPVEQG